MPCHGCATNFTLFTKEHTCPICRFSFCSKCLLGTVSGAMGNRKICRNCYQTSTDNSSTSKQDIDPPAAFLKRLGSIKSQFKLNSAVIDEKDDISNSKVRLEPKDLEIMSRLEKLRDSKSSNTTSDREIMHRLKVLKGLPGEIIDSSNTNLIREQQKSGEEEVDELLKQYMAEIMLEEKLYCDEKDDLEDIENRLRKLKALNDSTKTEVTVPETDDDLVTKKMIQKVIAEAELEKKFESITSRSGSDEDVESVNLESAESELPWCIICNEDAMLKCLGCDGSLYCNTCFKEGHEFFEMNNHITTKFDNLNAN